MRVTRSTAATWCSSTNYSVHGLAMLPLYICYSMFGFQRVGDGFGCSDTRAALRTHFAVEAASVAHAAQQALAGP